MEKVRENNYDLLRIICSIAVIVLHVSATYSSAITDEEFFGEIYHDGMLTTCFYNVLSRFAVPCFIMLSGAFILADERNADYKKFYRKIFVGVGVPTLIFSLFYFLYSILISIVKIAVQGDGITELLQPVKEWMKGQPFYHMWYLYMMIGVYLLAPVIYALKKQVGEKVFEKVAWIFLICACLGLWTSKSLLRWDIGVSFRYTGYFMIGYILRKNALMEKKNNKGGGIYCNRHRCRNHINIFQI